MYILIAPRLATPRPEALEPYIADVFLPFIEARPERFRQVFDDPENLVTIYRVLEQ